MHPSDADALRRDRDQLWAEAVHRCKANEPWWLETVELEALATVEQRARYIADIWQAPIEEWLDGRDDVTITEVLSEALHLAPQEHSQRNVNRVAAILTHAGFIYVRARKGPKSKGKRESRYRRES
jgi:putative DNA primase/helicase